MTTVVVGGALADKAGSGGEAWVRLSWVRGLQQLGLDVWFVEDAASAAGRSYFADVVRRFGLADRATLLVDDEVVEGPDPSDVADGAVLLNISGNLASPQLLRRFAQRVFVDIDPGFTQVWHAQGLAGARLSGHDRFVTIAEHLGHPDCLVPTNGLDWITTRQPVVLADWPAVPLPDEFRFTTVSSWRPPYGPLSWGGREYGLKVHEFRRIMALPRRVDAPLELALAIHSGDDRDRLALLEHGWQLADPAAAATPDGFRAYVQGSAAECSVAQGVYVGMRTAWFSDRTVRYLASGRPALLQETGFSQHLPSGMGLVPFTDLDSAAAGAARILADPIGHAEAARALAESHFAAEVVLPPLLDRLGIT
ncbi:MAG: glycosyltransferase [Jatrophihabitans sp.]|uniref:glycosyltransferase n=1 Tax=Jatrophihabitans sp. TaxID=1932789 RepID=UPI003F80E943